MTPDHFDDIHPKVVSGDTVNGKREDLGNACIEGIITPFRATHAHLLSGIFWEATRTKNRRKMYIKLGVKICNILINNDFIFQKVTRP